MIELLLVVAHLTANWSGSVNLRRYFDLNAEQTIASWLSASQLLVIGLLLLTIGFHARHASLPSPGFFRLVGLGFLFLSLDEEAGIHESISALTREYLSAWIKPAFNGQYGAWIFAYGALGTFLMFVARRNLLLMARQHRRTAMTVAVGFAIMVSGAVCVEIAGYYKLFARPYMQVAIEEFLEMLGATIMLVSVIDFFHRFISLRPAY